MLDITGRLTPDMWSYRPLINDIPAFEHNRWATVEDRGFESDWFAMPTLAGTYLETAKHLDPEAHSIDEIPVDRLFCDAVVAHVPKEEKEHIAVDDLEPFDNLLLPGNAFLISTGWDRYWNDSGKHFVSNSPHFDHDAMEWLVAHQINMLGGDIPCFDDPNPEGAQDVNTALFGIDALILAPLVNLGQWSQAKARLTVLPIPLVGSCGAPCRAILTELN